MIRRETPSMTMLIKGGCYITASHIDRDKRPPRESRHEMQVEGAAVAEHDRCHYCAGQRDETPHMRKCEIEQARNSVVNIRLPDQDQCVEMNGIQRKHFFYRKYSKSLLLRWQGQSPPMRVLPTHRVRRNNPTKPIKKELPFEFTGIHDTSQYVKIKLIQDP